MADEKDAEAEFWREDAERLNKMAERARKMGITVPVSPGPLPELDESGVEKKSRKRTTRVK